LEKNIEDGIYARFFGHIYYLGNFLKKKTKDLLGKGILVYK